MFEVVCTIVAVTLVARVVLWNLFGTASNWVRRFWFIGCEAIDCW